MSTPATRKVRVNFELAADLNRRLKLWCLTDADGAAMADVHRALVSRLLTDPELARQILADLTAGPTGRADRRPA